jgi:hypothetical protein
MIKLMAATMLLACSAAAAQEQTFDLDLDSIQCSLFRQEPNGSWTPLARVRLATGDGPVEIGAGSTFNGSMHGVDLTALLKKQCPR